MIDENNLPEVLEYLGFKPSGGNKVKKTYGSEEIFIEVDLGERGGKADSAGGGSAKGEDYLRAHRFGL